MGNKYYNNKISLPVQLVSLKKLFPNSVGEVKQGVLQWSNYFTPTPMSDKYKIKLTLKEKSTPKVYVVEPVLNIPEGKRLPHVYPGNRLCLYAPHYKQWDANLYLVDTIIPWISEWLFYYELWLVTGEWSGGGEHPINGEKVENDSYR